MNLNTDDLKTCKTKELEAAKEEGRSEEKPAEVKTAASFKI
jgi:hypothetical protein